MFITPQQRAPFYAKWKTYALPLTLSLAAFLFYLLTLAPTVLWGDDAYFQRTAYEGTLAADGGGHWLWFHFARLFVHLPFGDVAYRINLLSAVAAALTLFVLYHAARALKLSPTAAAVSALSLAVAHTFWMHAVRAEVYTLFTLWLAVEIWLWAKWRQERVWPIGLAVALLGIGLLGHQMAILLLPPLALLLWLQRNWLTPGKWLRLVTLAAFGFVPFFWIIHQQIGAPTLWESLRLYFTHSGSDFSRAFFDFTAATLTRDLVMWIGFLALQFVGLAGILGLWAIVHATTQPRSITKPWLAVAALYVVNVLFALSYRVNDQYVFYLPSFLAFALAAGWGWDLAAQRWQRLSKVSTQAVALLLLVILPPLVYAATGSAFVTRGVNPLNIRSLPGREPNTFFLWPGKQNYHGAALYGTEAMSGLPEGSAMIADHTPYETLVYLQRVEHLRPDIQLIKIEAGQTLAPIVASLPAAHPIYLADNDPRYYNLETIPGYVAQPHGVIYLLTKQNP
jgi:hypothetical protein